MTQTSKHQGVARPWTRVVLIGGAASASIGVAALIGWVTGSSLLMAVGDRWVPMAPSTGLLFTLFGTLAVLEALGTSIENRFSRGLAGAGTLAALLLLVLSTAGIEADLEHVGMDVTGRVGGASVGHMSPLTALGFLLAGSAILSSTFPSNPLRERIVFVLAVLVEILAATLITAYLLSRPLLYETGAIPPALNTAVAFLSLGVAALGMAARRIWVDSHAGISAGRAYAWITGLVVAASLAIGAASALFREFEADFREGVEDQLLAIADLKRALIIDWREELIRDGRAFYSNAMLTGLVEDALYGEDEEARAGLRDWLEPIRSTFLYDRMAVLDSTGRARLTVASDETASVDAQHGADGAVRALRSGDVSLEGFHRDSPEGPVHMTVLVPILDASGTGLGVLAIRVDPNNYLFPALERWPAAGRTAETYLVRRDGDDVLFLNNLRYRENAALDFRLPLSDAGLVATRAVLGEEGAVEGVDYRGVPVVAAIRSIPGSTWKLVARMDSEEAYGPLRQRRVWTLILVGLFLLTAITSVAYAWQRREKLVLRTRIEAEQRHLTLLRSIGDAVIATDAKGRIELLNPVAEELTGWSSAEAVGKPLGDVFHIVNEETGEEVRNPVDQVLETGTTVGLANSAVLIARDGTRWPIADSAAPVRVEDGEVSGTVLVFRDQTEQRDARRRLEAALHQSQRYLDVAGVMIVVLDGEGRVELINRRGAEILGMPAAEVVGCNWFDDFIPEEDRDRVRSIHRRIMAGDLEPVRSAENRVLDREGEERIIAWNNAVILGDDGQVEGTISSGQDVTQRRRAEQAIRESEARYRHLFNSIRDAIIVVDTYRNILTCNPAFTEIFGYEVEEIAGRPTSVLYENEEEFRRVGDALRAGDSDFLTTVHYRKASGETFHGETGAFHLTDSDDEVVGFVGLIRDVTKRLEAEQARARIEARYTDLFERAPVGIFHTRSDGRALAVNQSMARILGFSSPEEAVDHYDDIGAELYVRPERRAEFLEALRSHGAVEGFRYEARRADGRTIWIEMNARLADLNPDGTFTIEGFSWDITDRKRAEDAIRQQQEMLKRTESLAHIGSWELEVESGEVTWSDELFRILGRDPSEGAPRLGENRGLFPEDDFARLSAALERAMTNGEPYDVEVRALRPDGEVRYCRARGFADRGPDGRVKRIHGSLDDLTRQKVREQREQELKAQLAQAQKMEAVGRLAGGVAHDFNNMLSVILGHVELAQDRLDPEEPLYADLEEVRHAAESSADLTRQLLAFAREQVATPRVVDINGTVSSMLGMLRRLIGEDIELRWEPADGVWPLKVDPVQINQILANLLVNARDAIGGVGRVIIRTHNLEVDEAYAGVSPDAGPGEFVTLSVTDTGHGMDPDVVARVFDPFFTTKEPGEGTGLGLATVYGIVRQNDGFVTVYSEPDHGSTFKVHFPRYDGPGAPAETVGQPVEPRSVGGDETVLVVEDQPSVLRLVRKSLERLGYRVLGASGPDPAIEIAATHDGPIHLLITDVVMPGMNGRDLADRLVESRPELRTLFMSGYAEDVIAKRGVIEEGVHFLEKPFTGGALAAKVREAINGPRP